MSSRYGTKRRCVHKFQAYEIDPLSLFVVALRGSSARLSDRTSKATLTRANGWNSGDRADTKGENFQRYSPTHP